MNDRYKATIYLNFAQVQSKLGGRGRSSLYRDIEQGRLPKPIKFGGRLYWIEADIDAAIAAHAG
jgi:predicted DNA-binding transcriptional regulator AlpA